MEHKKQKKFEDQAFDKGYDQGFKKAYDTAYNKGYEAGDKEGWKDTGLKFLGATTVFEKLFGFEYHIPTQVTDAWTYVKGLPSSAKTAICGDGTNPNCINSMKQIVVNNPLQSALAAAGITLAYYIYTQVRGTPEEKAAVNRKLRQARRMTEEISAKPIKRRKTNKIKHLTKSFGPSESLSEDMSESLPEGLSKSLSESSSSKRKRHSPRERQSQRRKSSRRSR
jgi:hypothetical protein